MAITEALRLVIDARTDGAVRGLKAIERELDVLERDAKDAGKAFDRLGERNAKLSGLEAAIGGISARTGIASSTIASFGATAAVAGAGLAAVFGAQSVQAASDLNEAISKTGIVFGEAAQGVVEFAKGANAIGLSDRAALQAASSFGTLFVNLGQSRERAAEMSESLVRLASDLASFSNTSIEEAVQALQSGLAGETEPLRRYGVFLSDAALRQTAMREGLVSLSKDGLDPATKAVAAYIDIFKQTGDAQGDFERTSDDLANQTRKLSSNWEDLKASAGENLIPAATAAVGAANDILEAGNELRDAWDWVHGGGEIAPGFDKIAEAVNGVDAEMSVFEITARNVSQEQRVARGAFADTTFAVRTTAEAARVARAEYSRLTNEAVAMAGGLGIAAAQARSLGAELSAVGGLRADEGPGSAPPPIQINEVLIDFQTGLDRYRTGLGGAVSGGVADGLEESEDWADKFADYLEAVARERIENLGNVFDAISSRFNFDDAVVSLDEATRKLADLKAEFAGSKLGVGQQQSLVGQLLVEATAITPREQVAIEQAEKRLEDVRARFLGLTTSESTAAPGSSFLGPDTIDKAVKGASATLAELQVAEEDLAQAKADAVGPTRALEDAQKKLDDLRERRLELPGEIAEAERDLAKAHLSLVEAQRRQVDVGDELLDQGPEFTDWFKQLATDAGLPAQAIAGLTGKILALKRVAAANQGLVDVFGNGYLFQTPDQANATLSLLGGVPKFAGGGTVPGYPGEPQLVLAHGGERISRVGDSTGPGMTVNLSIAAWDQGAIPAISRAVRSELAAMHRTGR